jgi:hypothetical protein
MNSAQEPPQPANQERFDLDALPSGDLEEILIELLIVKYPGIEQTDVERFFHALDVGDIEQVERIEADMALKSARWKRAALEL